MHGLDQGRGRLVAAAIGFLALMALACYVTSIPSDTEAAVVLGRAADYASQSLADAAGRAHALVEIATGFPHGGRAVLLGHARLTAGLLAAGRVLGRVDLLDRGRALARVLLSEYLDAGSGLFRTERTSTRTYPLGAL